MAKIATAEFRFIPDFPVTRLKSQYINTDVQFPEDFVNGLDYSPHKSVVAKHVEVGGRPTLRIEDRYTPPAQTKTGPKIDPEAVYYHLVPGIVFGVMDAAIPAAALFHLGDRTYWSVEAFNRGNRSFADAYHNPPNAHDAAEKILTDKMGIAEMGSRYDRGWVKVENQLGPQKYFSLEGSSRVESLAKIISGGYTAVTEIAYASILLSHHIDASLGKMEPGDHIYVETVVGRQTPQSHFFVVEKQQPTTTSRGRVLRVLNENFKVLVSARSMYPFVCRDLDLKPKDSRFKDYRRDNGEAMLFEALAEDQGLTGPDPWWEHLDKLAKGEKEPFQAYFEKSGARRAVATAFRGEVIPKLKSVEVVFASSADSVPPSKRPEKN